MIAYFIGMLAFCLVAWCATEAIAAYRRYVSEDWFLAPRPRIDRERESWREAVGEVSYGRVRL